MAHGSFFVFIVVYGDDMKMLDFIIIVVLIVFFIINAMIAGIMQNIAEMKGHTERYWAWCFWVPIAGYAMVIALPDWGNGKKRHKKAEKRSPVANITVNQDDVEYFDDDIEFDDLPPL